MAVVEASSKFKEEKKDMKARSFFKRVPLWGKAVSKMALAAGIAAAVAGSGIMGDNLVKVQDPIIVDSVTAAGSTGVTFNDDLSFEVTAETYPGEGYDLTIGVTNLTSVDQTHRMTLDYPGGYVNRCVNDIRRRPSQPLIQWRFHPHTVHRGRRLRSTQGPSDA